MGVGLAVGNLDPVRPFEKDEVLNRRHVEGREPHNDVGGVIAGSDGEVLASEMRLKPESAKEIGDKAQMAHLLQSYADDCAPPVRDGGSLGGRQLLALVPFQAEGGVEVAAHQAVFDLGGFGQAQGETFEPIGLCRGQAGGRPLARLR